MLAPLHLDRIQEALRTPAGWLELGAILLCVAIGLLVDRRVRLGGTHESRIARIGFGSVNRLIFPLTTLALLLIGRALVQRWQLPAFFPIFIPLVIAFALIRLCVYAMHNLFGARGWLLLSDRAVSYTIWAALVLYYVGVLPEIAAALEETELTIGKGRISLLDLGRDALVIIVALMVSLWVSGLIEQWLLRVPSVDSNARVVAAKLFRAALLVVGVLIALPLVGIDLTVLSVFGGALGVGIGLGLQKLASNYIAGLPFCSTARFA